MKTQKPFNHLKGIIHGISGDGIISRAEFNEIKLWCQAHEGLCEESPFREFFEEVKIILEGGTMTSEEIWELKKIIDEHEFNLSKPDSKEAKLEFLQGVCYGILADEQINKYEVDVLRNWLNENEELLDKSPFKEMQKLLDKVMSNGRVDPNEEKELRSCFKQVIEM